MKKGLFAILAYTLLSVVHIQVFAETVQILWTPIAINLSFHNTLSGSSDYTQDDWWYESVAMTLTKPLSWLNIHIDADIPAGTDYWLYLANSETMNFVYLWWNLWNRDYIVDMKGLFWVTTNTLYYKISLFSSIPTLTPTIKSITFTDLPVPQDLHQSVQSPEIPEQQEISPTGKIWKYQSSNDG